MTGEARTRVVRLGLAVTTLVVLVGLVAVAGSVLWSRGDLNDYICDGDCGSANVTAPRSLSLDSTPQLVAPSPAAPGPVDPAKLSAAVSGLLDAEVLGPHVGFSAISPQDGGVLGASGSGAFAPASTTKVLTSFAALSTIDPGTRYSTTVVGTGGDLVLVGGGDPYLATRPERAASDRVVRADLTTLARLTATALKKSGTTSVSLGYDASLFTGPDASPAWEASYITDNIATQVSALWADQGVKGGVRSRDPAASAARTFADLLSKRGISVKGSPAARAAPAGATTVAQVLSATVAQIVERLIRVSDNQAAEVMLRHVAIAAGRPASFDGGTQAVRAALEAADVDTAGLVLNDGSGLARPNRITPLTLVQTLRAASTESRSSGLLVDLPVSGFTGTLVDRFAKLTSALGTVRAKTGTLTGIHSLAGYAIDAEGRPVLFAVMADRSDKTQPFLAQAALDDVAAAIAACRCG